MTTKELEKVLRANLELTGYDTVEKLLADIEVNNSDALVDVSIVLQCNGMGDESYPYVEKAAELGNARAMHQLADFYLNGEIERYKNAEDKAIPLLKKCADKGDSIAKFQIGLYYIYDNAEQDRELGIKYLKEAGDADGTVAEMVAEELFILGDYENALEYYKKATVNVVGGDEDFREDEEGITIVYYPNIADCYYYLGDYTNAIKYINKGIVEEYSYSFYQLGRLYYEGKGVEENLDFAIKYFEKAASFNIDQTSRYAYATLGEIYGNEEFSWLFNKSKALRYYEKAQKAGGDYQYIIDELKSEVGPLKDDDALFEYADNLSIESSSLGKYLMVVKRDLVHDFGSYWMHLSDFTQTVLTTGLMSLITFIACEKENKDVHLDYSVVILSLSRGLEREIKDIFCVKFQKYLQLKMVAPKYYKRIDGFVTAGKAEILHYAENDNWFTLGKLPIMVQEGQRLNYWTNQPEQTMDVGLLNFCDEYAFKQSAFSNNKRIRRASITEYMCDFAKQVQEISRSYRNESAHTSSTASLKKAKYCVDWIIKVKQLLYKLIEKVDYDKLNELDE